MSSPDNQINYARATGIHSVAGAAIFAALYGLMLPYFVFRTIRNPIYVLFLLTLFCAIRVTAFVMRAVLAGSESAGTNLGLVIGESIVYSVGFFGLLFSAYILVLDRETMTGNPVQHPLSRITSNKRLIHIALVAAVALGIVGSTELNSSNPSNVNTGLTLRRVSAIIFLVVTALLAIHAVFVIREEHAMHRRGLLKTGPVGRTHGTIFLCLIVIFLLIRQIYLTATISKVSHQNESEWYPLAALTEFLAVAIYIVPGLVPEKRDLADRTRGFEKDPDSEATELA